MNPDEFTNQELFLDVGDGHQLYVQDWGNEEAKTPTIFLHGGPGGSVQNKHRSTFDSERHRVIFFDQRGCGKSTPYGSLEHNTTQEAVEDILKVADKLHIERFVLVGGSWGSALAFFFALAHPERVAAMVLHGIWAGSKTENDWVDKGGFKTFYPDVWEAYASTAPASHRNDPSSYHFPRILGDDIEASKQSAYAYENLEGAAISLDDRYVRGDFADYDPVGVRIEVHYLANGCFVPDNYVVDNAAKLTMPIWMVQGRYDMVCPPVTAYRLNKLLPSGHLIFTTGGHKTEHESWNIMRTILTQLCED